MVLKAQLEALGLVIVVMLVALAMLFTIIFIMNNSDDEETTATKHQELANNFIGGMLKTNMIDCKNFSFTELYIDCAESEIIDCDGNIGGDSCTYLNRSVEKMLNNTLRLWGINYDYTAYSKTYNTRKNLTQISYGSCQNKEKEHGFFILPIDIGTLFIELDACLS